MTLGQSLIGASMRVYRRSPFYPRLGQYLGKGLAVFTRRFAPRIAVKEIGGVRFELDMEQVIDSSLYFSGTFEADSEQTIVSSMRPGMVAIDIGANFGYHTFRMAQAVGPQGKVIAVEPTKWGYDKLRRNAGLNSFQNIEFIKVGISDTDQPEVEVAFQASYRLDGRSDNVLEKIELITVDHLVSRLRLERVDFMKIDVDGFEGKVLRGAQETLKSNQPILFFEISPSLMANEGDSSDELIGNLTSLGYIYRDDAGAPIGDIKGFLSKIGQGFAVNILAVPQK